MRACTNATAAVSGLVWLKIQVQMVNLSNELSRSNPRVHKIDEFLRDLSDQADHAFNYPGVWDKCHDETIDLFRKAITVTLGSTMDPEFKDRCVRRLNDFIRQIQAGHEARQALKDIGCAHS